MALTISNWGNVSTQMNTPRQNMTSEDWAALGRGLGGLQKWSQRQKAADLMEGKAAAQDRIKAIDEEIASLEAKLQGFEEKREADTLAAQRRAEQEQKMQGYAPASAGRPTDVPQVSPQFTTDQYQDQYLATQQALAAQPAQPNRSYSPYDRNARMNAEYGMNGYRPNFNGGYRWGR